MSFSQRLREIQTGFERPFWVANISELFERLSYYAAFASLARYLNEALNFPVQQAGSLTGLFGGLVWFLAAFGGTLADRLGFRPPRPPDAADQLRRPGKATSGGPSGIQAGHSGLSRRQHPYRLQRQGPRTASRRPRHNVRYPYRYNHRRRRAPG